MPWPVFVWCASATQRQRLVGPRIVEVVNPTDRSDGRVVAYISVCFLAYVLWKTLGQLCSSAGLGDGSRRVVGELSKIRSVEVVLPTRTGPDIRTRCVSKPFGRQRMFLKKLNLEPPSKTIQKRTSWKRFLSNYGKHRDRVSSWGSRAEMFDQGEDSLRSE